MAILLQHALNLKRRGFENKYFYDSLADLNNFYNCDISDNNFKTTQIEMLKRSYEAKEAYLKPINKMLAAVRFFGNEGNVKKARDDVFAQFIKGVNTGLDAFPRKDQNKNLYWIDFDQMAYEERVDAMCEQVNRALASYVKKDGLNVFPAESIMKLKELTKDRTLTSKDAFVAEKGLILEKIGENIIEALGLRGFETGAWAARKELFNETTNNQIIEDILVFLKDFKLKKNKNSFFIIKPDKTDVKNGKFSKSTQDALVQWLDQMRGVSYKARRDSNGNIESIKVFASSTKTLKDVVNLNNSAGSGNKIDLKIKITLGDSLYEQLYETGISIQAKSNDERHLANHNVDEKTKIDSAQRQKFHLTAQTAPDNSYSLLKQAAFMVSSLQENNRMDTPYEGFSVYANLALTRNLLNTVYAQNELYLTVEGFTTLAGLMEERNFGIFIKQNDITYRQFLKGEFDTRTTVKRNTSTNNRGSNK